MDDNAVGLFVQWLGRLRRAPEEGLLLVGEQQVAPARLSRAARAADAVDVLGLIRRHPHLRRT